MTATAGNALRCITIALSLSFALNAGEGIYGSVEEGGGEIYGAGSSVEAPSGKLSTPATQTPPASPKESPAVKTPAVRHSPRISAKPANTRQKTVSPGNPTFSLPATGNERENGEGEVEPVESLLARYHCGQCHGAGRGGITPEYRTLAELEMKRSGDYVFARANLADGILNGSTGRYLRDVAKVMPGYEKWGLRPEEANRIAEWILRSAGYSGRQSRFNSDIGKWPRPASRRRVFVNTHTEGYGGGE